VHALAKHAAARGICSVLGTSVDDKLAEYPVRSYATRRIFCALLEFLCQVNIVLLCVTDSKLCYVATHMQNDFLPDCLGLNAIDTRGCAVVMHRTLES
jgi:hypothetical protein